MGVGGPLGRHAQQLKPAIVLAHGLVHPLGHAADVLLQQSYFTGIPAYLRSEGYSVLDPRVSSMGHVADRAEQLKERILAWEDRPKDRRLVVVAHSMGGLDSRFMLSRLGGDEFVSQLITIGCPHRGNVFADAVVRVQRKAPFRGVSEALERAGVSLKALECLTTKYVQQEFNHECRDSKDVLYQSVSGRKDCSSEVSALLKASHSMVLKKEGPNDGMVSIRSATWGEHLGTYPCDHLEQLVLMGKSVDMYNRVLEAVDTANTVPS